MKPEIRALLNKLDEYLANASTEDAGALWFILSGLRGPDYYDDEIKVIDADIRKSATTAIIRAKAFPLTEKRLNGLAGIGFYLPAYMRDSDDSGYASNRREMPHDHFGMHARDAFTALGLKWEETNCEPAPPAEEQ